MTWSVSSVGKPAAVKASLASQFASAKKGTEGYPHECESVSLIEKIVNDQLDFLGALSPVPAVRVSAHGSCWKPASGAGGDSSVKLEVAVVPGFVE